MTAVEIAQLDVLNESTVSTAIGQMGSQEVTRLIITDKFGIAIYDSSYPASSHSTLVLFPEVFQALQEKDVFSSLYNDGVILSRAAVPVYSNGVLTGCVYMMEHDTTQGALIQSLIRNIFSITVALEIVIIFFSLISASAFSSRLRRILASMRVVREGDYTQRVKIKGNDELAVLGTEFNELTYRLQTSEERRRQFVSDASHELKTPLASIKLLTDSILQNDMDIATIREFVSDIGNEADRLNRMSHKLLTLSKLDAEDHVDGEVIHMLPTLDRVARMLSANAKSNKVTLLMNVRTDCVICIPEDDLYQIAFNLVENSIKYNQAGGKVFISLFQDGQYAVLQVRDTGVGIPEAAIGHIFERFYRVDKARSRKTGGSGLGLSIVSNIVERNNGTIQVESTVGKGTTFTVRFPICTQESET